MSSQRSIQYWVIPPEANAEFVAHMEDVLDVYSRPYDPNLPVLCMDEQPVQLIEETREPIAATKDHPQRVDYEYKRAGVANIFMFAEPLAQWRQVSVREKKPKSIGPPSWPVFWKGATRIARKCWWSVTTSTPTHWGPL